VYVLAAGRRGHRAPKRAAEAAASGRSVDAAARAARIGATAWQMCLGVGGDAVIDDDPPQ
jgi:hypothetical protein